MRTDSLSSTEEVGQLSKSTSRGGSLSNMYERGTLCFLPQVECNPRGNDTKEGRISLQRFKCRLVFHLTIWRDVWIPCGHPMECPRSPPYVETSHPFDTSRCARSSVLQKVTMSDSSGKLIGIAISLCQLESDSRSPASPPEASVLSCQDLFKFLKCPS